MPNKNIDNQERLSTIYKRCKFILSNDMYFKKLQNYFITNSVEKIDSVSRSEKYDYSLKELQTFMQTVYIGISHFCYINYGLNNYTQIVDTTNTLFSWYYVKYQDNIYKISELDGELEFYHTCEIIKKDVTDNVLDLDDIISFYQKFNPERPHDKIRVRE